MLWDPLMWPFSLCSQSTCPSLYLCSSWLRLSALAVSYTCHLSYLTGYKPQCTSRHFWKKKHEVKQETGNGFTYNVTTCILWGLHSQVLFAVLLLVLAVWPPFLFTLFLCCFCFLCCIMLRHLYCHLNNYWVSLIFRFIFIWQK